ncbi:hypothetical protein ACS5PK_11505 [Roseateles sp. DB2]|uniref:hypothetical protein n=1 Tax=Roseateles sp. DB2 TaxID=3453717 RepID=UPI003EEA7AB3
MNHKRYDANYAAWGLHLWDGSGLDVSRLAGLNLGNWGAPVPLAQMPGYSAGRSEGVFELPVLNPQGDASRKSVEFIIHGLPPREGDEDGRDRNIRVADAALSVGQQEALIVGQLDGRGLAGAGFQELVYIFNTDKQARSLSIPALQGKGYRLHPVHLAGGAAGRRTRASRPRPATRAAPVSSACRRARRWSGCWAPEQGRLRHEEGQPAGWPLCCRARSLRGARGRCLRWR